MAPNMHLAIQGAILNSIDQPSFSAALPPLSDRSWVNILGTSPATHRENERLEFLGDALMYATLGRHLYKEIPEGDPGLFTNIRSALHSNVTFSSLAEKLDIFAVNDSVLKALTAKTFGEGAKAPSKSRPQIKATADLFETVIGAYYLESGFESLCDWVDELYKPLVAAAKKCYLECRFKKPETRKGTLNYPSQPMKKLKNLHPPAVARPAFAKHYLLPSTPHRAFKYKQATPRRSAAKRSKAKRAPVVIDLTADDGNTTTDDDDDDDDDDAVILLLTPPRTSSFPGKAHGLSNTASSSSGAIVSAGGSANISHDLHLDDTLLHNTTSYSDMDISMDVDCASESELNSGDDSNSSDSAMLFVVG